MRHTLTEARMRTMVLGLVGLACALAWLVLLVATGFSIITVSLGLLPLLLLRD